MDTPIPQAERVVSAGKGIGEKKNMKLVESLAKAPARPSVLPALWRRLSNICR